MVTPPVLTRLRPPWMTILSSLPVLRRKRCQTGDSYLPKVPLSSGSSFALFLHRFENVGVAVEGAADEDLGEGGPVRHFRRGVPLGWILQHIR